MLERTSAQRLIRLLSRLPRGPKPLSKRRWATEARIPKVPESLVQRVRSHGFRGSGQNFRKLEGDFVFVVNFQGSEAARRFYINLGAQPVFIAAEGNRPPDPKNQKEYECVFRRRVRGGSWPWDVSHQEAEVLAESMNAEMAEFFARVLTLRQRIDAGDARALISEQPWGVPSARAALHVARACRALGRSDLAREMAEEGLRLAGDAPTILLKDLRIIISSADQELSVH